MRANQAFRGTHGYQDQPITLPQRQPAIQPQASVLPYRALEFPAKPLAKPATFPVVYHDMHPGMYGLLVLCWAALIGIFWLTFAASAQALFMIGISTAYAGMFFGVPFVMSRFAPEQAAPGIALRDFLRGKIDTIYGPVNNLEALAQMVLIPLALSLGGIAIAFIVHADRIAH
jgi:hypothetical protein